MRKMLRLFDDVALATRVQVELAAAFALERRQVCERAERFDIWQWEATVGVIRDAESRARAELVDSEEAWRTDFFAFAFALRLNDSVPSHSQRGATSVK